MDFPVRAPDETALILTPPRTHDPQAPSYTPPPYTGGSEAAAVMAAAGAEAAREDPLVGLSEEDRAAIQAAMAEMAEEDRAAREAGARLCHGAGGSCPRTELAQPAHRCGGM